jgi:hypothetical protein
MVRGAAAVAHLLIGGAVAWWAAQCCGPDIIHADRGVELLGAPSWLLGAVVIARGRTWLAAATPIAWFALMFAAFAVGVYLVAYNP